MAGCGGSWLILVDIITCMLVNDEQARYERMSDVEGVVFASSSLLLATTTYYFDTTSTHYITTRP